MTFTLILSSGISSGCLQIPWCFTTLCLGWKFILIARLKETKSSTLELQQLFIKFNCYQVNLKDSWFTYANLDSKGVSYRKYQKETIILAGAQIFMVELISKLISYVPMFCFDFFCYSKHSVKKKDQDFPYFCDAIRMKIPRKKKITSVNFIQDFYVSQTILHINGRKPDWCWFSWWCWWGFFFFF